VEYDSENVKSSYKYNPISSPNYNNNNVKDNDYIPNKSNFQSEIKEKNKYDLKHRPRTGRSIDEVGGVGLKDHGFRGNKEINMYSNANSNDEFNNTCK